MRQGRPTHLHRLPLPLISFSCVINFRIPQAAHLARNATHGPADGVKIRTVVTPSYRTEQWQWRMLVHIRRPFAVDGASITQKLQVAITVPNSNPFVSNIAPLLNSWSIIHFSPLRHKLRFSPPIAINTLNTPNLHRVPRKTQVLILQPTNPKKKKILVPTSQRSKKLG